MNNQERHIVSKINWDLLYDDRKDVQELQSTFGGWSKVDMLAEMNLLFNKLCPPDQIWRINRLELNLGEMSKDEIADELPWRFRTALYEKLIELTYRSGRGNDELEVLNSNDSLLSLLEKYLESGYLPWNETGVISINYLFLNQLDNNEKSLSEMILQVGKSMKVRKRIAWQFEEAVIKKLVALIEPNNSDQISAFTDEFITLQEKENIVKSNNTDFKKNLWFWVLNHLFDERGTLFNRIDFMQSSILQMAQHHNMSYDVLFSEIQLAVNKITAIHHVKSDFILTLSLLAKRNKSKTSKKSSSVDNQGFYIDILNNYFTSGLESKEQLDTFNWSELLIHLSKHKPAELSQTILKHKNKEQRLLEFVSGLNEAGLKVLLQSLVGTDNHAILETIQLLQRWVPQPILSMREWYLKVTLLLLSKKDKTINKRVLRDVLKHLGVNAMSLYKSAQDNLKNGAGQLRVGSDSFLETVEVIRDYFYQSNEFSSNNNLVEDLDFFLSTEWSHLGLESQFDQFAKNKRSKKNIQKDPKAFLTFIADQKYTEDELLLLFLKLNQQDLLPLVYAMIRGENSLNAKFLKRIVQGVTSQIGEVSQKIYAKILAEILSSRNSERNLPELIVERILQEVKDSGGRSVQEKMENLWASFDENTSPILFKRLRLVSKSRVKTEKIGFESILLSLEENKVEPREVAEELIALRKKMGSDWVALFETRRKTVLQHFLPKGSKIERLMSGSFDLKGVLGESKDLKMNSVSQKVIFWNVLLEYQSYQGNENVFLKKLRETLNKRIQISTEFVTSTESFVKPIVVNEMESIEQGLRAITVGELGSFNHEIFQSQLRRLVLKSPFELRRVMLKSIDDERFIDYLNAHFSFDLFLMQFFPRRSSDAKEFQSILVFLKELSAQKGDERSVKELYSKSWRVLLKLMRKGTSFNTEIKGLVKEVVSDLVLRKGLNTAAILSMIRTQNINLSPSLKETLIKMNPTFASVKIIEPMEERDYDLDEILDSEGALVLINNLLFDQRIPSWFELPTYADPEKLLKTIIDQSPELLVKAIIQTGKFEQLNRIIARKVKTGVWMKLLKSIFRTKVDLLGQLEKLLTCFERGDFPGKYGEQMKVILFRKINLAVHSGSWKNLAIENSWNELIWEAKVKHGISKLDLIRAVRSNEHYLSTGLRLALNQVKVVKKEKVRVTADNKTRKIVEKRAAGYEFEKEGPLSEAIAINNAGLVIANSYINMLFNRLGLLNGDSFSSVHDQCRAVHYLQFIVNGLSQNEEHFLVLNKVLVGLHPVDPVPSGAIITAEEKKIIEGMLQAMINYWTAIGESSIQGFRGNWLVRNGVLREEVDRWTLDVEKRAYDILLNQSPFSFGIIKYPWMEKAIHVNWAY